MTVFIPVAGLNTETSNRLPSRAHLWARGEHANFPKQGTRNLLAPGGSFAWPHAENITEAHFYCSERPLRHFYVNIETFFSFFPPVNKTQS